MMGERHCDICNRQTVLRYLHWLWLKEIWSETNPQTAAAAPDTEKEWEKEKDCSRASIPYTPSQSNTMYFIFLSLFLLHTQTRSPLHLWRSSHFTGLYQGMPVHLLPICLTGITDERGKKGGGRKEVCLNCSVTLCAIHSYLISI